MKLEGHCDPGFERVKEQFMLHLEDGKDDNAQLCIYHKDKCVVDLWGSRLDDQSYGPDTLQIVFSSGKNVAAFIVAMMVERGLLDYSDKVVKHWPEFGQNGKDELTIADILRHEGGLEKTCRSIGKYDAMTESIKENLVGKVFEDSTPMYQADVKNSDGSESKRSYHATARGSILNEIVRRVDPKGRTMGEILKEDIKNEEVCCGMTPSQLQKVGRLSFLPGASVVWNLIGGRRGYFGFRDAYHLATLYSRMRSDAGNAKPFLKVKDPPIGFYTSDATKMSEIFSCNVHTTARGLARLGIPLANDGHVLDGNVPLLSKETIEKMHEAPKKAFDAVLGT